MRSDVPSALTSSERALLAGFLSFDFEGVAALRAQAARVTARRGCTSGCGTISFVHDRFDDASSSPDSLVPVEGSVDDDDGQSVGGLLLILRDGLLDQMEIYAVDADPLPLPDLRRVTWWRSDGGG
ncbi:hypothetical protein [Nocardioides alkalitolerans]|uniref:hypothetical protein n=1 Tax=Nocardioides alkalitolerans TaxID=281714 RepID=UPI00041069B3|nr:hypothetical protein [Nocardioides alkalitolerans]